MSTNRNSARRLRAVAAGLVALLSAAAADALEFQPREINGRSVVIAQGEFVQGDRDRLAQTLDRVGRVHEIWFHSPGGLALEGNRIGLLIRERGIATRVPARARCASACTDAFLGGVSRAVDEEGALGVHMPTISRRADAREWVQTQVQERGSEATGPVIRAFEQMSARFIAGWMRYVFEMGVSPRLIELAVQTPADSMHWLTAEELRAFNVVSATTSMPAPAGAAARPAERAPRDDGLPRLQ